MTILELRAEKEATVEPLLNRPRVELLILYRALYALGCRIDGIDFEIDRLLRQEIKERYG
jgi:hypothetical protein